MDRIQAELAQSRYVDVPHLVIGVNGRPLDEWISDVTGRDDLWGLVATLDGALINAADRELAWQRADPAPGRRVTAPLLVCPDDLDFNCTTVVADIARLDGKVRWLRLGVIEAAEEVSIRDLIDAESPSDVIEAIDGMPRSKGVSSYGGAEMPHLDVLYSLDRTGSQALDSEVSWYSSVGGFEFDESEYRAFLADARRLASE